jgi:hypothetical protein
VADGYFRILGGPKITGRAAGRVSDASVQRMKLPLASVFGMPKSSERQSWSLVCHAVAVRGVRGASDKSLALREYIGRPSLAQNHTAGTINPQRLQACPGTRQSAHGFKADALSTPQELSRCGHTALRICSPPLSKGYRGQQR